ncbi:hypothetical protein D3C74_325150 [compost metagenome]
MLKLRDVDIYGFEITENYYLYHLNYALTIDHEEDSWQACLAYNIERKQWQMDSYEGSAAQLDSEESDFLDACQKALNTELNAHVKMLKSTGAKLDYGTLYKYLAVTKEEKDQHVEDRT